MSAVLNQMREAIFVAGTANTYKAHTCKFLSSFCLFLVSLCFISLATGCSCQCSVKNLANSLTAEAILCTSEDEGCSVSSDLEVSVESYVYAMDCQTCI